MELDTDLPAKLVEEVTCDGIEADIINSMNEVVLTNVEFTSEEHVNTAPTVEREKMTDRESNVFLAKFFEENKNYHEMVESIKMVGLMNDELTVEESNLLNKAYKRVTNTLRITLKNCSLAEQELREKEPEPKTVHKLELILIIRKKTEKQLNDFCSDVLNILENHLIPSAPTEESKVFYHKMKGDYHRYSAEIASDYDVRCEAVARAFEAYAIAGIDMQLEGSSNDLEALKQYINLGDLSITSEMDKETNSEKDTETSKCENAEGVGVEE